MNRVATIAYDEVIETNGVKVPFVPGIITPPIEKPMRNNRYEGGECNALRELLEPGDRVLELGAGVGLLSTVAATSEGVRKVVAVEANPDMIPLIRETHSLNGVENVTLLNGVVAPEAGDPLEFYLRADFWASSMERHFAAPIWMTFKQARELGGHVRKGEKGSPVVYANTLTRTETDENTGEEIDQTIPFMKGYTVFNVEQVEGLPDHFYAWRHTSAKHRRTS